MSFLLPPFSFPRLRPASASSSLPYRSSTATSVSSMKASSVAFFVGFSTSSSSPPTSLSHTPFSSAEMSFLLPPFSFPRLRPASAFAFFAAFFFWAMDRTVAISSSVSVSSSSLPAPGAGAAAGSSSSSESSPKSSVMIAALPSAGFSVSTGAWVGTSSLSSSITGDIGKTRGGGVTVCR